MSRRIFRHTFVSSLAALVVTLLSLPAAGAQRDYLLRWIVPPDPDVAGYRVYVALRSMDYDQGVDIGPQLPDPQGIASYLYGGLESDTDYYVVMTAYNTGDLESVFSNEIVIQALACDPTACEDANPCTVDACSGTVCTNDPVLDGTGCDDEDPATVQDACFDGICMGVLPECNSDLGCEDGNPCTVDRCDPVAGCMSTPVVNGTACDDDQFCTVGDTCVGGSCQGGPLQACSMLDDQCTVGECDEGADRCEARPDREGLGTPPAPRRASCCWRVTCRMPASRSTIPGGIPSVCGRP